MEKLDSFSTAWMSLTYNCNNRCKWCYASSNIEDFRSMELNPAKEDEILELLRGLGLENIRLIGGEPTVYENIVPLTGKLSQRGFRPSIVTNGRMFSNIHFAKAMKKAGLIFASFSVEGYNQKIHEKGTCVKGSFDETLRGLYNANAVSISTTTNTTITRDNMDSLDRIIDLLEGKVEMVTFNICSPCLKTESNAENAITPSEGAKAFQVVYSYAKSKGMKTKLVTPTPICNFDYLVAQEMKKDYALSGRCQMVAGNTFVLDYNGDILPCTHFSGYPLFNIFEDGKIDSPESFIEKFNSPSEKCTQPACDEFCTGGCPLFWTSFDPDKQIKGKYETKL